MKNGFDEMDLQWFADMADAFDEDEEGEFEEELVIQDADSEPDPDDGLPEEVRGKTRSELWEEQQKLSGQVDTNRALKEGLEGLAEKLRTQPQSVPQQFQPQKGESIEDVKKRINEQFYKSDDPAGLVMNLINVGVQQAVQPIYQSLGQITKKNVESDENNKIVMEKYGDEVQQQIGMLSPQQRANPQALMFVLNQVKAQHMDEIFEERMRRENEEQDERGSRKERRAPLYSESSGRQGSKSRRRVVRMGAKDYEEAAKLGVSPQQYAEHWLSK